jgi:hypothetical protein
MNRKQVWLTKKAGIRIDSTMLTQAFSFSK